MINRIYLLFILSVSLYIFFAPIAAGYNLFIFKKFSIILMLLSLVVIILLNNLKYIKLFEISLISFIVLLAIIYLFVWDNYKELNLIISIIIGFYISKQERKFKNILLLIFFIQFLLICYEFIYQKYIFDTVVLGIDASDISKINLKAYGDVGFRPKGLFYGTLEATSFSIIMSFIFRKNFYVLLLLLFMAILLNGRLAILIVSIMFFLNLYNLILHMKISQYIKIIFTIFPMIISIIIGYIFIHLQSSEAISHVMNVFNLQSDSNYARILYFLQGVTEYLKYDFLHLIFGNSNYFYTTFGHSAESGWINQLLNIGLMGFFIYFLTIFYLLIKSFRKREYLLGITILFIIIAITIYRFETGYLRGVLLWFYIFTSLKFLRQKSESKKNYNN